MRLSFYAFALLFGPAVSIAAEAVPCPDLAVAVQAAACPTDEDLQFTFTGYCSDNARMYGKPSDVCVDYERYRKMKNLALWESVDGKFQAYVSCDLSPASVRESKASAIEVSSNGGITRLACRYPQGVIFTYRTRAVCKIDSPNAQNSPVAQADCTGDAVACRASCE